MQKDQQKLIELIKGKKVAFIGAVIEFGFISSALEVYGDRKSVV